MHYFPSSVCYPPSVKPLQIVPLTIAALHTEHNRSKENKDANSGCVENGVDTPAEVIVKGLREPINAEAGCEDGEVESRIVVVNVGDARHDDEWKIVEEPADHRVDGRVVNLVNVTLAKLCVAALPSDEIPEHNHWREAQRQS